MKIINTKDIKKINNIEILNSILKDKYSYNFKINGFSNLSIWWRDSMNKFVGENADINAAVNILQ